MTLRSVTNWICVVAVALTANLCATAVPIEVGTGENSAELYVEWGDGYIAEFIVDFESASITGLGLFDIVEAQTTLTTVREDFGWGVFIDGIEFNGHSNIGFGGGEDWWHYWIKDAGETQWTSPAFGAVDRILYDGYSDGWIYGRAGAVPEPATLALFALGGLLLRKCRK